MQLRPCVLQSERPLSSSIQLSTTPYSGIEINLRAAMVSRRNRTLLSLAIFLGVLAWNVAAAVVKGETGTPVENLTVHDIEEQLQVRHSPHAIIPLPCTESYHGASHPNLDKQRRPCVASLGQR